MKDKIFCDPKIIFHKIRIAACLLFFRICPELIEFLMLHYNSILNRFVILRTKKEELKIVTHRNPVHGL